MREITKEEQDAMILSRTNFVLNGSMTARYGYRRGFIAGLEYQDKRIEELEAEIIKLSNLLEDYRDES